MRTNDTPPASTSRISTRPSGAAAPVQSLERGLLLLDAFRERESLTLAELTAVTGLHRTSTLRLLQTLERNRFVERDAVTRRYRLGTTVITLGALALARHDVRTVARPVLETLAREAGETVQLVVRDGVDMLVLDGIESSRNLRVGAGVGERRPLHATASGKCLLAGMAEQELETMLGPTQLPARTAHTIVERARLMAEVRQAGAQGYAVNLEESEEGVCFVAAPIFGPGATIVGALAVGGPAERMTARRLQALGRRAGELARQISARLGARL